MEKLILSLNQTLDLESFNYKTFSRTKSFMSAGMNYLKNKYINRAMVFTEYIDYKDDYNLRLASELFISSRKIYMVLPLEIPSNSNMGHSNVLFFYKKQKAVYCERYDPQYSCCMNEEYHKEIDAVLSKNLSGLNIIYISPKMMTVIVCPQGYIKDNFGYCQTYNLIYIDNLLSMPRRNRLETMALFPTRKQLDEYIKEIVKMIISLPRLTKKDIEYILNFDNLSKNLKFYVITLVLSIIS